MPRAVSANPLVVKTTVPGGGAAGAKSRVKNKRKARVSKKVNKKEALLAAAKARVAKRRAAKKGKRTTAKATPPSRTATSAQLAAAKRKAARRGMIKTGAKRPTAKVTKRVTKVDVPRPPDGKCRCGCGGATARFFCLGHDTRFHGRLRRIRRGEGSPEKLLGKRTAKRYKWKKVRGGGFSPDVDYAGRKFKRNKSNS